MCLALASRLSNLGCCPTSVLCCCLQGELLQLAACILSRSPSECLYPGLEQHHDHPKPTAEAAEKAASSQAAATFLADAGSEAVPEPVREAASAVMTKVPAPAASPTAAAAAPIGVPEVSFNSPKLAVKGVAGSPTGSGESFALHHLWHCVS